MLFLSRKVLQHFVALGKFYSWRSNWERYEIASRLVTGISKIASWNRSQAPYIVIENVCCTVKSVPRPSHFIGILDVSLAKDAEISYWNWVMFIAKWKNLFYWAGRLGERLFRKKIKRCKNLLSRWLREGLVVSIRFISISLTFSRWLLTASLRLESIFWEWLRISY